jgi:hypothetical protein
MFHRTQGKFATGSVIPDAEVNGDQRCCLRSMEIVTLIAKRYSAFAIATPTQLQYTERGTVLERGG